MSWDEAFSRQYEQWSADMTADVPFYVALAREAHGRIVEVAIGNGRVAIPVAQATGRTVIGIDSSPGCSPKPVRTLATPGWSSSCTRATCRISLDEPAALI